MVFASVISAIKFSIEIAVGIIVSIYSRIFMLRAVTKAKHVSLCCCFLFSISSIPSIFSFSIFSFLIFSTFSIVSRSLLDFEFVIVLAAAAADYSGFNSVNGPLRPH